MKPGTRVKLIKMSDPWPVKAGTVGIVDGQDALGDYLVSWSNGSTLKLIPETDQWEVIDEEDSSFPVLDYSSHRLGLGNQLTVHSHG